ncbi:MAG: V-type ATP synthase subunit I [Lachnospiraceae bacterium]|nr:V-type ATP synthase subunit I [Lachnospiraceae bacterium]
MAVVKMSKLNVIGLNENKAQLLSDLINIGVVEISNQDSKLTDEEWSSYVEKDGDENGVYTKDIKISEVSSAIEALDKYYTGKKPLFKTRKPVTCSEFQNHTGNKDKIFENVELINKISKEISCLRNDENRIKTAIIALKPWVGYDLPLEVSGTKYTSVLIGTIPVSINLPDVEKAISEVGNGAVLYNVSTDDLQQYVSVVCLIEDKGDMLEALRQYSFNPIVFSEFSGKAAENIVLFEKELSAILSDISEREEKLVSMSEYKAEIEYLYDDLVIERDKIKILSNIVKTKKAFYFDGWMPESTKDKVKEVLDANGCYYEIKEPEKGEETPILTRQGRLSEPFGAITDLYSTPSINDIDPTPFIAPFYFIFFGLMLSDASYGIILTVACFIILKKYRLEGLLKKLVTMFMYCGISTAFWGVMFGGYFGDLIPVAAKTLFGLDVKINPAWFDPVKDPMKLLIFSLILGVIHLFTGMGIKAYMLIKSGHLFDAICDIFLWYILLIGLVLFGIGGMVAPVVTTIGKVMSIVGALGILFTAGREKKGIIGKLLGGLGSLYGSTGYLSDVLSYSRLLALGLATGVIAQVVNTLGSLAGGGIVGALVMLVAIVVGHSFNFAINVLGSFVHASRLQYVEFFGKFFEGGGTAFNPFNRKTKYVEIIDK